MKLSRAKQISRDFERLIKPVCQRVETVGSIRRQKEEIKDIDILCEPIPRMDIFGAEIIDEGAPLYLSLESWTNVHTLKGKLKQREILWDHPLLGESIIDLHIVTPPAQWGVMKALRTGGREFSKMLVTSKMHNGYRPQGYSVKDGAVWQDKTLIETPTEKDLFKLFGIGWIPPEKR